MNKKKEKINAGSRIRTCDLHFSKSIAHALTNSAKETVNLMGSYLSVSVHKSPCDSQGNISY